MRLVFLGTPAFAVPTLERLVEAGHQVLAVVTQPDRPRGRGQHPSPPPVKEAAARMGLPVYQPERVRLPEAVEFLRALGAEAMVVVGYGQIIPQSVIDLAPLGIVNVHASLLPKYRGAGPIQWAILNGETRTGVTTMRIDAGLDTGDMLLQTETEIGPDENAVELGQRLAAMGADLLVETLAGLAAGRHRSPEAGFLPGHLGAAAEERRRAHRLEPAGAVDSQPRARFAALARRIHHFPRPNPAHLEIAPSPWPLAPGPRPRLPAPGPRPLVVRCGAGALELLEVQLEGRKRISAADFANGQRLAENEDIGGLRR